MWRRLRTYAKVILSPPAADRHPRTCDSRRISFPSEKLAKLSGCVETDVDAGSFRIARNPGTIRKIGSVRKSFRTTHE